MRALGLALVLAAALPAAALAQDERASLTDIEDEVMCPICGTPLELSQSPQADRERELIRRLIAEGRTKEEIKDALVAEYGPEVLAIPEDEGFDLAAWIVPAAGLAGAIALIAFALRRRRRDPQPASASLDPDEAARLREDMSRYEP